jgi:hypothetical protein
VFLAWLLFPLVMLAVCTGCGLLVQWVAGGTVPGAIVPSLGLALMIVVATLTTDSATTAPLTTAIVVLLAIAGYAASWRTVRAFRLDPYAAATGAGVFCVCAAPVVVSGNATFLGYFLLNDAAIHFSMIAQLMSHGRDLSGLPPSAYSALLNNYFSTAYPTGADVALGALRPLVGQDVAWVFQPYLAVILGLGATAAYQLLDGVVSSRPLRAGAAFVAGQAALLYAYYLEASIKELATSWLITVTVVLVIATLREEFRVRRLAPLIVVAVAGLDLLDLAIVPWLGPPLAFFVVAALWRSRNVIRAQSRRRLALGASGAAVILAVLLIPIIGRASTFLSISTAVLTQQNDLGNLIGPLPKWQMFGIWPVGDFRFPVIDHYRLTYALIGVEIAAAVFGAIWAVRRRKLAPLLLLLGNGIAVIYLLSRGSPYASAKVMMIFSVTPVLIAMLGAAALVEGGRQVEGWLLAAAIAAGVLWSNALGYHDASIAPRSRLAELASIGARFAGQQPAFFNLSDEFAAYFLRSEAPTDPGLGPPAPRPGTAAPPGREPWDPDDLPLSYLESFRLLVLGNSPLTSRPPSNYQLAYKGRYYDVWRRTADPEVLEHVPFGASGALFPFAIPRCSVVRSVASRAGHEHAQLAYVQRSPIPMMVPASALHPPNWGLIGGDPYSVIPRDQPGAASGYVRVTQPGRYSVVVEGDISQRLSVYVDTDRIGSVAYQLGPPGQVTTVGQISLSPGRHLIAVLRPDNNLTPGDGGTDRTLGPVMLLPQGDLRAVSQIDPSQARSLCGKSLDWLEIVR